jgi:hypothetical protein
LRTDVPCVICHHLNVLFRASKGKKMKATLVLVILFSPTIPWSQTKVTDQSNPPEYAQQSPTSQSDPAPAPATDSSTVSFPDQSPAPQNKKDDSQGQQTKRMFWLVPNFAAVSVRSSHRCPPARNSYSPRTIAYWITPRLRGPESWLHRPWP